MFRAIWIKTLRDYRVPVLTWGIGIGLMMLAYISTYQSEISTSAAQQGVADLAGSFTFFGAPIAVDTTLGYTTWKILDLFVPAMLSVWAVLAGGRMLRGEEEKGSMDILLATPHSRTDVVLQKLAALGIALVVIGVLIGLGTAAGEASGGIPVDIWGALLAGLNASLLAGVFGMFALFISQFVQSQGAASGIAGATMVLSFVIDSLSRSVSNPIVSFLQGLSPFYYYNWNKPLLTSSQFTSNPFGYVILLALVALLGGASVYLFTQREVGGVAQAGRVLSDAEMAAGSSPDRLATRNSEALAKARRNVFGHSIGLQAVRAEAVTVLWWLIGVALYTAFITAAIPTLEEPIKQLSASSSAIKDIFSGLGTDTNAGFLSALVFQLVPVFAILFVMTIALSWPSDLDNGRMELVLGTPEPRSRVMLERMGAVLLAAIAMPLFIWISVWLGAQFSNLSIDVNNLTAASLGILPLEVVVIALVFVLSARLKLPAILGIVSTFIIVSFLLELLGAALNLPSWVMSLSMFHAYGNPMLDGWQVGPFFGLIAVAVVLIGLGVMQFTRADVERGS